MKQSSWLHVWSILYIAINYLLHKFCHGWWENMDFLSDAQISGRLKRVLNIRLGSFKYACIDDMHKQFLLCPIYGICLLSYIHIWKNIMWYDSPNTLHSSCHERLVITLIKSWKKKMLFYGWIIKLYSKYIMNGGGAR